jgi:hypothetical protein
MVFLHLIKFRVLATIIENTTKPLEGTQKILSFKDHNSIRENRENTGISVISRFVFLAVFLPSFLRKRYKVE